MIVTIQRTSKPIKAWIALSVTAFIIGCLGILCAASTQSTQLPWAFVIWLAALSYLSAALLRWWVNG